MVIEKLVGYVIKVKNGRMGFKTVLFLLLVLFVQNLSSKTFYSSINKKEDLARNYQLGGRAFG